MITDKTTTISELRHAVHQFVAARRWQPYHTPKNLAMSIAIEAAELMEHYQWSSTKIPEIGESAAIAAELADILIYCLSFANAAEIDISTAIMDKLATNENRFPVP